MENLIGKVLDNRYEIQSLIGVGGMAYVYKAKCRRLDRLVAIKVLKPEYTSDYDVIKRFKNESNAVARLSHNNIVNVYDVSSDQGVEYMVMELIEGLPFKQYLINKGKLTWEETAFFVIQIAEALEHAHSRGIIHQDIKPHNIMLIVQDGTLKVADFGIAHLETDNETKVISEALGSLHYVSPEQAKGNKIDNRTDIYSLGVVMYEMVTGNVPYEGESAVSIVMQHINGMPVLPTTVSDIPKAAEEIILKAMSPYVENRFANAREIITAIQEVQENPNKIFAFGTQENDETRIIDEGLAEHFGESRRKSSKVNFLLPFFLVIVIAISATYFIFNQIFNSSNVDFLAPNLVSHIYEDLDENEIYEKYNIVITSEIYSNEPQGTIISQEPVQGSKLTSSMTIYVTVSLGSKTEIVTDVTDKDHGQAELELKRLGFEVIKIYEASEDVDKEKVIKTMPEPFEELSVGETIILYVSSGKEIELTTMPDLQGYTIEEATSILAQAKLYIGEIKEEESIFKTGTIIWQGDKAGIELLTETEVAVTIAKEISSVTTDAPTSDNDNSSSSSNTSSDEDTSEALPEELVEVEPKISEKWLTINVPTTSADGSETVLIEVVVDNNNVYSRALKIGAASFDILVSGTETAIAYVYADGEIIKEEVVIFN